MEEIVDVFFDAKELRWLVHIVEDREHLANVRTHKAVSKKILQKEKLKRASEGGRAEAFIY